MSPIERDGGPPQAIDASSRDSFFFYMYSLHFVEQEFIRSSDSSLTLEAL
jgi:hypothetical protein